MSRWLPAPPGARHDLGNLNTALRLEGNRHVKEATEMGSSAAQLKWPALPLRPHCWWPSGLWEPSIGRQVLLPGDTCTLPWHPELVWHGCGAPSMGCWLALAAQALPSCQHQPPAPCWEHRRCGPVRLWGCTALCVSLQSLCSGLWVPDRGSLAQSLYAG